MRTSYSSIFVFIIIILTVLRLVISAVFPLSSDEAYHWEWSRHLAFGYYDHPPMTAYVIFIFTRMFGDNEIGVRFGAIVLMTFASIVMFKLGKDISGDVRVAFWSGLLVNILPVLNVFFVYMSTDPPTIFFWALMLWLIYRAIFQGRRYYWYLFGLALGGALMTKFLNVLLVPSITLFILCSRKYRRLFFTKEPYLAGIIALIMMCPFIYWNATHGWATFYFNFAARQTIEPGIFHFIAYIGGQALVVSPLLFIGFIYIIVRWWREGLSKQNDLYLFFAATSSVMFVFFLLISFVRSIGAHWPAAGYLTLCVGLPYAAFKSKDKSILRHARKSVITAVIILLAAYSILFVAYFLPNPLVRFVSRFSEKSDEIYEMHGYREIASEAERRAKEQDAILISPSYAFCSMLSFYSPSQVQTHMFGKGAIHGLNYIFWDGDYSQYIGSDALWVYKEPPKKEDIRAMQLSFESVGGPEEYHFDIDGGIVRKFYFIRCRNLMEYRLE